VTEAARNEAPKADPQAIFISLNDIDSLDISTLAMNLTTPCLLVQGQNDPAVEMLDYDTVTALPEQVHHVIFEQSGHFPMLDESSKYNRLLTDFLALNSGQSPRELQLKEEWKRRVR